jgi:hypothetical protein
MQTGVSDERKLYKQGLHGADQVIGISDSGLDYEVSSVCVCVKC